MRGKKKTRLKVSDVESNLTNADERADAGVAVILVLVATAVMAVWLSGL